LPFYSKFFVKTRLCGKPFTRKFVPTTGMQIKLDDARKQKEQHFVPGFPPLMSFKAELIEIDTQLVSIEYNISRNTI